ncbi:MAG: dephospho-CoA kinase [Zwartia sp.]|jgi:dephospho-CoA kinase
MFRLGLTGGIGSGKTQVANLLADLGASVIDTDLIAHQLTAAGGRAIEPIQKAFGDEVIEASGALNRARMRELVFAEPARRAELEAILHPLIGQTARQEAEQAVGLYVVFVVPLLVESGRWRQQIDRLCVVDCDQETQIERVQARSGIELVTIQRILAAQATREQRLAVADDVIDNSKTVSLEALKKQVLVLHQGWCNLAKVASNTRPQ